MTSPKQEDILHKVENPQDSFWTFKRKPTKLKVSDIVWVVKNGFIVGGFYVRRIVYAQNPVRYAFGHNPVNVWRVWFSGIVPDEELEEFGILDEKGNPKIKIKGFQGFRYQWW